jgi:glutamate racemase
MNNQPIGIFDSGIGGLTVASAINKLMPHETIVYFGDTAHTPWGNQSAQAIAQYCTQITEVLLQYNCKAIVIACNTASSSAVPSVENKVINLNIPVINVIDPSVKYICQKYSHQNIGIIGTKRTIKSDEYAKRIHNYNKNIHVVSQATPLLVPLIEENYINSPAMEYILHDYLNTPQLKDISALILGCTHYPLIKKQIEEYFKKQARQIEVLDSASIVATHVQILLHERQLLCAKQHSPVHKFLVSHDHNFFNETAKKFFQGDIELKDY